MSKFSSGKYKTKLQWQQNKAIELAAKGITASPAETALLAKLKASNHKQVENLQDSQPSFLGTTGKVVLGAGVGIGIYAASREWHSEMGNGFKNMGDGIHNGFHGDSSALAISVTVMSLLLVAALVYIAYTKSAGSTAEADNVNKILNNKGDIVDTTDYAP